MAIKLYNSVNKTHLFNASFLPSSQRIVVTQRVTEKRSLYKAVEAMVEQWKKTAPPSQILGEIKFQHPDAKVLKENPNLKFGFHGTHIKSLKDQQDKFEKRNIPIYFTHDLDVAAHFGRNRYHSECENKEGIEGIRILLVGSRQDPCVNKAFNTVFFPNSSRNDEEVYIIEQYALDKEYIEWVSNKENRIFSKRVLKAIKAGLEAI